jgi:hypothetical protein
VFTAGGTAHGSSVSAPTYSPQTSDDVAVHAAPPCPASARARRPTQRVGLRRDRRRGAVEELHGHADLRPYNDAAKLGQTGSVPDGKALAVYCAGRESVLGGTAKINRKTSYGTAKSDVLTLDVIGTFYDTDRSDYALGWGAFANPTKKSGWNSVTITVTCRRQ